MLFRPLDEKNCQVICPIAAGMTGVCLTGITVLRVVVTVGKRGTIADNLLALDALLFLVATLTSYLALRVPDGQRLHRMERAADLSFIAAMLLLTLVCFVITFTVTL